jgi:outer membrane biosynthesis protein TonB
MARTKSFSFFAFIIALMVHFIVFLGMVLFSTLSPKTPPETKEKEQKSRFKISMKERPKATKEALVKNTIPKTTKALPMPKGEQLKTLSSTPKAQKSPTPQPSAKPQTAQPNTPMPEATPTPPEPKRAFERHVAPQVSAIEHQPQPKKEQGLYDFLSKADPNLRSSSSDSMTKVSDNIQKLYGDKFGELSSGEQKYILDNQETMRRITQGVLDRYGRSKIPDNLHVDETNTIEFYLHPDGSISDMHFLSNSRFSILNDTTKETIELAYSKYPRPAQKTLIRYRVWYNLR